MTWLKWDATLELGHAEMDADHRQMVIMVNRLLQGIADKLGKQAYDAELDALFAHTKAHFDMEERLMAACSYPYAAEHRSEHARLIKEALDHRARFDASAEPSVSLLYFLDQWLTRHILSVDSEFARFLAADR